MQGDCREWFWKDDVLGQSADRNAGVRVSWTCIMESGRFGEGKRTHELEPVKRNIRKLPPSSVRTTPPSSLFLPKLSTLPLQLLGFPPGTFHLWNAPLSLSFCVLFTNCMLHIIMVTLLVQVSFSWLNSFLFFTIILCHSTSFSFWKRFLSVIFAVVRFAQPVLSFWCPLLWTFYFGQFFTFGKRTKIG